MTIFHESEAAPFVCEKAGEKKLFAPVKIRKATMHFKMTKLQGFFKHEVFIFNLQLINLQTGSKGLICAMNYNGSQ
jgi:hypothetical protein